ncbi:MAG: sensor histidine kinase, partial [Oscillospiraceae bacterium]
CFLVSDNGIGIPAEYLTYIFEDTAMYRTQSSGDNTKNMGIGLSVCSTIIRSHGGTITAENKPESGAAFLFTLPMKEEYDGDQAENTDS